MGLLRVESAVREVEIEGERSTSELERLGAVLDGRANRLAHMERKETWLWPDQYEALRDLAWSMRLRRRNLPDRDRTPITVNSLIRVAVDLLLAEADRLDPASENAMCQSVGLAPRDKAGRPLPGTNRPRPRP